METCKRLEKKRPQNPWARYADDGVILCNTREEAENLLKKLQQRFAECGLELHPDKTKIIYCKDNKRTGSQKRAENWLGKMAQCDPKLFVHWQMGILPTLR